MSSTDHRSDETADVASSSTRLAAGVRLGLLGLVLVGMMIAAARWGTDAPERLRELVADAGPLGPLLFIAAYALLTVAMFPGTVSSTAAGVIFGPLYGTLLTVIGATLGAVGGFLAGRRLGRASVEQFAGGRVEKIDEFVGEHPLRSMLALRLTPLFPFNLVNYASGLTRIGLRDYTIGTAIGIIPGSFAFVALGSSLEDPGSPRFWASLAFLVALMVAGWLALKVGRKTPPVAQP